jgi:hypothetical protein
MVMGLSRAQAEWELQNLYEDLVLARGHVVIVVRQIRSVVKDPRNRSARRGRGGGDRIPYYTSPEDAIAALRSFRHLAYLHLPGRQNRIKPDVLLARYEAAVAAVDDLTERIEGRVQQLAEDML